MPVWNERATIAEILSRVLAVDVGMPIEVIVVEDCSTDGTREWLVANAATDPRVRLVLRDVNDGKASAVREGIAAARGEYLVIQDADLEYEPREFRSLLDRLRAGPADVVNGSRYPHDREVPDPLHRLVNKVFTTTFNLIHGTRHTDLLSCYKVMRMVVAKGMRIRSRGFQLETEMMTWFARKGLRVIESPISYRPRSYAEGKKISWKDTFRIFWAMAKFAWLARD